MLEGCEAPLCFEEDEADRVLWRGRSKEDGKGLVAGTEEEKRGQRGLGRSDLEGPKLQSLEFPQQIRCKKYFLYAVFTGGFL